VKTVKNIGNKGIDGKHEENDNSGEDQDNFKLKEIFEFHAISAI
jgi:hypothetical protein